MPLACIVDSLPAPSLQDVPKLVHLHAEKESPKFEKAA